MPPQAPRKIVENLPGHSLSHSRQPDRLHVPFHRSMRWAVPPSPFPRAVAPEWSMSFVAWQCLSSLLEAAWS
eukprot:8905567-Alexandrium_andersonii.AAC.1